VIRQCGLTVFNREYNVDGKLVKKWQFDPLTRDLKFTSRWVFGALRRKNLVRKRVTTCLKSEPSTKEIHAHMKEHIHKVIEEHDLNSSHVFNSDETGVRWAEQIKYQYVPKDAHRAIAPPGDETGRFTALLGSNGSGDMLPMKTTGYANHWMDGQLASMKKIIPIRKVNWLNGRGLIYSIPKLWN
jgi:hypothetical protein